MNQTERFKQIVNKKWYIQGFNGCLNFTFAAPQSGLWGCHHHLGYGYTEKVFIFKKDYLEYLYLEEDFKNIGNIFLEEFKKNPNYLLECIKKDHAIVAKTRATMEKIDELGFKEILKLKENELIKLYQEMQTGYHGFMDVSHIIEPISFVVEPLLKAKLEKALGVDKHEKEFRDIFNKLMQPSKPSFANDEHIGILEIMKSIADKDEAIKAFNKHDAEEIWNILPEDIKKLIKQHKKRFIYNQLNYYHGEPIDELEYVKEIKKMFNEGIDAHNKIIQEKNSYENNKKVREKLMQEHKFDDKDTDIRELVGISIETLHWQDDRKKNLLAGVYYMNLMLKVLGEKFNIKLEHIKRYLPEEITLENMKNFNVKDAEKRMKQYIVYSNYKKDETKKDSERSITDTMNIEVFMDDDYDQFIKVYHKTFSEKNDIHGNCASSGIIQGIVRVCKTKEDLEDFKEGEILVASMTRPEFVPAMKKAAAIVTDEGGITCHAAIVSRELGKPCVIGTKIATKTLKNGQIVEVNANHGTVRIIK